MLDFKYIVFEMPFTDCFYGTNLFKVVTQDSPPTPKSFEGNIETVPYGVSGLSG